MAYNYNPNQYKKRFDEMFGAGSYDKGMGQAKKVGYWKAQPEIEKMKWKQRQEAFKEAERQRKEAEREAEREYKAQVAAEKKANAEKYRMQEKAKKQGRGGVMPSREQERKEVKTQSYYKKHGKFPKAIQDELDSLPTLSKAHIDAVHKGKEGKKKSKKKKTKKKKGFWEKTGDFLSDVGHDVGNSVKNEFKAEKKKAVSGAKDFKYAVEALNPFDKVSAKEANAKSKKNHQKLAKSKAVKEQDRNTMRIADSATLGLLSNVEKRVTGKDPSYKSKRKVGKGGASDAITDALGVLAPAGGSYKAVKGLSKLAEAGKIGKTASKTVKGAKGLGKFNKEVLRGMGAGALYSAGELGIRNSLNGKDYTWKDNVRDASLNVALGGISDGGGHLLGRGIKTLAKGNKASQVKEARNVMNDDPFNVSKHFGKQRESVKGTFDGQDIVDTNVPRLGAPKEDAIKQLKGSVENPMEKIMKGLDSPIIKDPAARFRNSVEIEGTPQLNAPSGRERNTDYLNKIYADYEKILNGTFKGTKSQKQAIQTFMQQNPDFEEITMDQLEQLANPLKFKKQVQNRGTKIVQSPDGRPIVVPKYEKDDFLTYKGNMTPNQRVAQRMEGQFSTTPTNDGLKIQQDQPLPFMKQEPALNFKKTVQQEIPRKDLTEIQTQDFAPDGSPAGDGYDYKNPKFATRMYTQFFNDEIPDGASEVGKKINRDSISKLTQLKEKLSENTKGFRTKYIDDLAPLESLEKKIRGGVASAEDSLYKQARLFRGSPERAHQVVNEQLAPIVKEMKVNNIKLEDLVDYATAIHARDLNRKGLNSGFSDAELQKDIIRYESPIMEKLRRQLVDASNNVTKRELVDTGMISKEGFEAMRAKHPNYMPMFRHFDDDKVEFSNGISSAIANANNPIKKFKGSDRDIIDPIESMVKNMFNAVAQGDKQRVARQLGKLAVEDTEGTFIRRLSPDEAKNRKNTVKMYEDGKEVYFEVEPEVYKSIKGLDKETSNTIIKILAKPASTLRAGATLTPEFFTRNFLRDVPAAYIVSKSGFNPIFDFSVGLWQSMSLKIGGKTLKEPGKLYKDFIRYNGGYGNIFSHDRRLHQDIIEKVLKEGDSPNFINVANPKSWLNVLRSIADVTESATKVGEFNAALRKGVSPQEAAYRARDIMDFARSGSNIREANKVVAFLNANIQGKDKLLRSFAERPASFIGKSVAAVSIPTLAIIAAQRTLSSDTQKNIIEDAPQWLKNTFWLIPVPNTNQVVRIPKPFDLAPLFADPIERAADYAINKNPDAFDKYIKGSISSMSIPVMLTGITPIIEGMANYSFFRQGPIDPMRDQNKEYPDRYDINTSETAKWIGKGVNAMTGGEGPLKNFGSPRIVDNAIRGIAGGLGTYGTEGIDKAIINPLQKLAG
ncbi:hypothetical protein OD999_28130, partial [Priestia megaterium]|uniref:LPD38 domain-containing protein n=3 Tax=Priestia TaxID=2800373 RepID=UPI00294FFF3F